MTPTRPWLRFRVGPPREGWCSVKLEVAEQCFESSFSHVPADTLRKLLEAADAVATGPATRTVVLHEEPSEIELTLVREVGESVKLAVVRYPDRRRSMPGETVADRVLDAHDVARAVWRGFRDLEGRCTADAYQREWHNGFPKRELDNLGAHVNDRG